MTSRRIALVCGAAPGSVGEALCERFRHTGAVDFVLYLDRTENPNLATAGITFAACDFSARSASDPESVSRNICNAILSLAQENGKAVVSHLFFCSGIYANSTIGDWDIVTTTNIISINLVGLFLTLHGIHQAHASQHAARATSHVAVYFMGSEHAVSASAGRAAYCAAKTGAVGALLSLRRSCCIGSAVWIAVGPIDTPMLHRNQWVIKARGSEQYYEFVTRQTGVDYNYVFRDCDQGIAHRLAAEGGFAALPIKEALDRYIAVRQELFAQECGVHSANEVALSICEHTCQHESGDLLRISCFSSSAVIVTPLVHWAFAESEKEKRR